MQFLLISKRAKEGENFHISQLLQDACFAFQMNKLFPVTSYFKGTRGNFPLLLFLSPAPPFLAYLSVHFQSLFPRKILQGPSMGLFFLLTELFSAALQRVPSIPTRLCLVVSPSLGLGIRESQ